MKISLQLQSAAAVASIAAAALSVSTGAGVASADGYSAPYIRMMDVNRFDIVMESETRNIASNPASAAWACREVIGGAATVGALGGAGGSALAALAGSSMCVTAITTCAAQAAVSGKWGGMTFTVVPPNYWCWKY